MNKGVPESNILFENQYTITSDYLRTRHLKYFSTGNWKYLFILNIATWLGFLLIILFIVTYNLQILIIAICFNMLMMPLFWLAIIKKQREFSNGKLYTMKVIIYRTHYYSELIEISYRKRFSIRFIRKVKISDSYIHLITWLGKIATVKKNSFTKGTLDEFLAFLQSKDLKIEPLPASDTRYLQ